MIILVKHYKISTKINHQKSYIKLKKSGGDRSRTGVQTYPSKAFYMLISLLLVGNDQGKNQPNQSLAASSFAARTALRRSILFCFFKSAAELGNRTTCSTRP